MNATQLLVLRTALTVAAAPCFGMGPGFLCDPVVTYTNGMRLASSTADRSHNVYWRCDPMRVGYCEGCYHSPCHDDARALGTRRGGEYVPPCTPRGAVSPQGSHYPDGLEAGASERLGPLPASGAGRSAAATQGVAPAAPETASPTGEGLWIEAIQALGQKASSTFAETP